MDAENYKDIKQAKALLFSFRAYLSFIPFFIMVITSILYGMYIHVTWNYFVNDIPISDYKFPEWFLYFEMYYRHFFDASFLFILCLTSLCQKWRLISKVSIGYMWILWLFNLVYIIGEIKGDLNYYTISSAIYLTFVILTGYLVSKR